MQDICGLKPKSFKVADNVSQLVVPAAAAQASAGLKPSPPHQFEAIKNVRYKAQTQVSQHLLSA
eukprot:3241343-Amphidinium_carterae.1